MSFPKVAKGVGRIFLAEILEIVGMLLATIGGSMVMVSTMILIPGILVMLVGLLLMLFAYIWNIVGVKTAAAEEDCFQTAFIMIIFELVLAVVVGIFTACKLNVGINIGSTFQRLANLFATYYIIMGTSNVLAKIGQDGQAETGANIGMTILILNIASCVFSLVPTFTPNVIDYICYAIFLIVVIVTYIMLLVFLARAKSIIKKASR